MAGALERTAAGLRIKIDPALCVGFADCIAVAPEAFILDSEGVVSFVEPEGVERERLISACEACPVDALLVWDADGTALVG